ncbi:MAG: (deoxy)nucleoside triphosphate pyrophosphohydrolase [Kibdelosporangium sp.]
MPTLRTTALIDAQARLVSGAVIELASRRAQVVSVHEWGATAVLRAGPLRAARLTALCAATGAGTLLTCSLEWVSRNAFLDMIAVRGPVLSLLDAVAQGAKARAEALTDAQVVVGTAIVRDGRLLAQQRAFPAEVAGLWELPGGRVEPGETDQEAVRRECAEELGIAVIPGEVIGPDVILPSGRLLRIYRAETDADPVAVEHKALRWLKLGELGDVDWLPADRLLMPVFRTLLQP